jgi:hypothetical protein
MEIFKILFSSLGKRYFHFILFPLWRNERYNSNYHMFSTLKQNSFLPSFDKSAIAVDLVRPRSGSCRLPHSLKLKFSFKKQILSGVYLPVSMALQVTSDKQGTGVKQISDFVFLQGDGQARLHWSDTCYLRVETVVLIAGVVPVGHSFSMDSLKVKVFILWAPGKWSPGLSIGNLK